ncbi:DUF6236 family protein [Pseudomonas aeruginosa]
MGEAKYRKANDPNYGKPPPKAEYRGLIVSPPITVEGDSFHARQTWLDPTELRFSLLFWDRLTWPTGGIKMTGWGVEEYLEECGILDRPHYGGYGLLDAQIAAYLDKEAKDPGAWAIAQGENSLLVKGGACEVGNGALIELSRAIPIPAANVHLNEILELKERRKDELMRFRLHMEAIAHEVANSPDRTEKLQFHINEINAACSDLMALGKDWQFPMNVSTMNVSLNLKPELVGSVMGAWEFGAKYCAELAMASAAAAGLYHGIKINGGPRFRPIRKPISPYRYAYRIHTELV